VQEGFEGVGKEELCRGGRSGVNRRVFPVFT
jgi:hypothetical protein